MRNFFSSWPALLAVATLALPGCTGHWPAPPGAVIEDIEAFQLTSPECEPGVSYFPYLIKLDAHVYDEETELALSDITTTWVTGNHDLMLVLPEQAIVTVDYPTDNDNWVAANGSSSYFMFTGEYDPAYAPSYFIGETDGHGVASAWVYIDLDEMCQRGVVMTRTFVQISIGTDMEMVEMNFQIAQGGQQ